MEIDNDILECLPVSIQQKMTVYHSIDEIRIRVNRPLCFTIGNKNLVTDHIVTKEEIEYCLNKFCKNSLHTYFETIKKGYIPFGNGYRIGVCGEAVNDKNSITNISRINSLNIRIPSYQCEIPISLLNSIPINEGTMIYSPANYGKTTLLRSVISHLSLPPYNKRIAVIDTKNELYSPYLHKNCPVDFYTFYPKYEAINMAIQTMSPEIVVCDEIGIQDDISPLIECKNCGVVLICSAHARTISELMSRNNIKIMHENGVFGAYIGINMTSNKRVYNYANKKEVII